MTRQTENFKNLVKGNSIEKIITALKFVSPSVREELKNEYKVKDLDELAFYLA